ncbi:hypothetical protein HYQ44_011717 [Verticillium longisporum]|nr:hypothetical protein HYQ44_011717 [Verticillium longisporum]
MLQRDLHRDQRSLERLKPLVPGAAVALCPDVIRDGLDLSQTLMLNVCTDHYVVGPATTYVSDQIATSHNPVFAPPSPMMIQPTDFIRKVNHTGTGGGMMGGGMGGGRMGARPVVKETHHHHHGGGMGGGRMGGGRMGGGGMLGGMGGGRRMGGGGMGRRRF